MLCFKLENDISNGKYQIVDVLGNGVMSVVYLTKYIKLQKFWAIKQVKKYIRIFTSINMFIVSAFLITSWIFMIKAENIKEYNTMIKNGQYDQCIDFVETYVIPRRSSLLKDDNLKYKVVAKTLSTPSMSKNSEAIEYVNNLEKYIDEN